MGDGNRLGQQIGNYRLEKLLGSGGFADVYLGRHVYLDSPAAIKMLRADLSQEEIERFRQEARTLIHLIHPHIVRVLDFGLEGHTPFLVMDYAPNGTLRQRYRRGERVPLATVVDYVQQIASALQYAHDEHIVHRDIKPENMLLGRQNEVLLSDFGIAIVMQSTRTHLTQEMTGTVTYMAPEQIQSRPRPASDQYSLGVIVYEWLSGTPPFSGTFTELAVKHMTVPAPPLRERMPGVLPGVEQVVLAALAKDPAQRFGSIRAFATALEQASRSEKVALPSAARPSELPPTVITSLPPQAAAQVKTIEDFDAVKPTEAALPLLTPQPSDPVTLPPTGYAPTQLVLPPQSGQSYNPVTPLPPMLNQAAPARRGMSRRALLIAGISAVGVVAAGGAVWALTQPPHSSSPPVQTTGGTQPTPTQASNTQASTAAGFVAADTFTRPDQTFWGTATDGRVWGGDANQLNEFSISGGKGLLQRTATGRSLYTAVLGAARADAGVTIIAALDRFNPSHIGSLLRYADNNNYYKAFIDGNNLNLLRRLYGKNTSLGSVPFASQGGTMYTLRFQVVGTTLRAKAWQTADAEPADWMIMATDATFQKGLGGLRPQVDQNVALRVSLFRESLL